jgi:hypothetical protein
LKLQFPLSQKVNERIQDFVNSLDGLGKRAGHVRKRIARERDRERQKTTEQSDSKDSASKNKALGFGVGQDFAGMR